jgi:2-polyprenyl-6-hydroxyphenyl methylase / 3-demethylubiquinone-9 3-methyltransferase
MNEHSHNVDPGEVAKFDDLAARWWDPHGDFRPLHDLNPLRLGYIDDKACLAGKRVIDVGCGGGILSESMVQIGASVVGIDAAEAPLGVARLHQFESGVEIDYRQTTAEQVAAAEPHAYDVVTCMELLEHVPDPASLVQACATLVKPGGHVFFSTINRNPKAYLFAVIGAEYVLRLLPRGTHEYNKFIRPSELHTWARRADLNLRGLTGMSYNPLTGARALTDNVDVNYIAWTQADVEPAS